MAKYRHIHTSFWTDPKVAESLTPEDRYFFLYLLSNPHTKQTGIYMITKRTISFEVGYTMEMVEKLMQRMEQQYQLIKYSDETREIAIKNWGKYNLNKGGKPVMDCISKELKEIKDRSLIQEIIPSIENEAILALYLQVQKERKKSANEAQEKSAPLKNADISTSARYVHDTSTIRGQKEKEKEKEKEICAESSAPDSLETEFAQFWEHYPKRTDKKAAFNKYKQARKTHDAETILEGAKGYKKECSRQKTESKYIKHAKTFLHNESYLDYLDKGQGAQAQVKRVLAPISANIQTNGDDDWWQPNKKDNSSTSESGSGLF